VCWPECKPIPVSSIAAGTTGREVIEEDAGFMVLRVSSDASTLH
jgi:hypothetical protein